MSHVFPSRVWLASRGSRAGASEVTLLMLGFIILLALATGILFIGLRYDTNPAGAASPTGQDHSPGHLNPKTVIGPDGTRVVLDSAGDEVEGLRSAPSIEVTSDLAYRRAPRSYEGTGLITGKIKAASDLPFPDPWRLVIEPSKFVQGREHADPRQVLTFDGNQRTFEVYDLALGAYRVYAEGKGVDTPPYEVLLYAIKDQPPAQVQMRKHLLLQFQPVRGCSGSVVDQDGTPVADLPTFLVATQHGQGADLSSSTTTVLDTVTEADGSWSFPRCQAGEYRLVFGSRQRPLIEAKNVTIQSGVSDKGSVVIDSKVPKTQTLYVQVFDPFGRGLPGARLRGIGPSPLDVEVDHDGVATAPFLLPGTYRLSANYGPLELTGEERVIVNTDGVSQTATLICRPKD